MTKLALSASDIIALAALLISAFAAWKTVRFNERQKSLIESQDRLNRLLLEKEQVDAASTKRADVGATLVSLGNSKFRLRIYNRGKSAAKHVSIEFPDGNDLIPPSEMRDKFPFELLETGQSVELIASVHMQTKRKQFVVLKWKDDFSDSNEKKVSITI